MRRLIELSNRQDAAELVRRLNDASLYAVYTEIPSHDSATLVGRCMVWLGEDDDMTVAKEVVDGFVAEGQVSRGGTCFKCCYDLRGHSGEGECPECGWRFQRSEEALRENAADHDIHCASCGEDVPADFECCWNCGAAMS